MVNAYALPGGKISITRGLLARMGSEDELAAVLGHEIGHVTARHAAQQYTRQILTQLVLIGGMAYMEAEQTDNRELYALGGLLGAQLAMAHYSREQERQADELGLEYMVSAGYNPNGMVDLLETLQSGHDREPSMVEQWFSTHPMTSSRVATARERVAALGGDVKGRSVIVEPYVETSRTVRVSREAYDRLAAARQLLAKGSAAEARQRLEPAVSRWPEDGLLRAFYAAALLESGDRRRGLDNAFQAAEDAPDIFHPQLVAGEGLLESRRYAEAVPHLERATTLLPDIPAVELLRAQALEGAGRRDDAITAYRRVVQLDPSGESGQRAQQRLQALGAV
jgi:predicted Zn-dependent protease